MEPAARHVSRVVMAVNNAATTDYRVVKTAEMAAAAGYECHVVGLARGGLPAREVIAGVTYHRVALGSVLFGLACGFWPQLAPWRQRLRSRRRLASVADGLRRAGLAAVGLLLWLLALPLMAIDFACSFVAVAIAMARRVACTVGGDGLRVAGARNVLTGLAVAYRDVSEEHRNRCVRLVYGLFHGSTPGTPAADRTGGEPNGQAPRIPGRVLRTAIAPLLALPHRAHRYLRGSLLRWATPARSPLGVRLLFGRYLAAYLPLLDELDGDIYHAHELWMLEACAQAARLRGARLVYDSHELEAHRNIAWSAKANARRIAYERDYVDAADAIFTVSAGLARIIGDTYARDDVRLLRNTPWRGKLRPAPRGLRTALGLGAAVPLVVYTGSLTINRGLEMTVAALARLPDFHFATVGPWSAPVKAALEELAGGFDIAARVHLHPRVPPEELIDFIASADIAVIPIQDVCLSYRHCMPNKLFEAAFAGLPVVASDLPDLTDFITRNGIGETFRNDDVDSLVAALRRVYDDRSRYYPADKLAYLREHYAFEREVGALLEDYRRLAAAAAA